MNTTTTLLSVLALSTFALEAHAAPCGEWAPNLSMAPTLGRESASLTAAWQKAPACPGFELDHYEVCWSRGDEAPASPEDAVACEDTGLDTRTRLFVYRADKAHSARVFACADADCSSAYGSFGRESIATTPGRDDASTASTEPEVWVMPSITDYDDTDRVISDPNATAASALFAPAGWTGAGALSIWYSTQSGSSIIRFQRAEATGWQDFNHAGTSFSPPIDVAVGVNGGTGNLVRPSHPWVVPEVTKSVGVKTVRGYRMFVQTDDDGAAPFDIVSVRSVDDVGDDFGLQCDDPNGCTADGITCCIKPYWFVFISEGRIRWVALPRWPGQAFDKSRLSAEWEADPWLAGSRPWKDRYGIEWPSQPSWSPVHELVIPLWIPLAMIGLPTARRWFLDFWRRIPPGHCRRCGYDLMKNESGVCPECGGEIDPVERELCKS